MKIENLRFGFACNSSSVHSVVSRPNHKLEDRLIDGNFGWEKFVATSSQAKKSYLKTVIINRLSRLNFSDRIPETARLIGDYLFPEIPDGYIDHQSVPLIPRKYGLAEPCYNFFYEMMQYLLREDVVIYGGNDNEAKGRPPKSNVRWFRDLPKDMRDETWVCRQEGDWWVLFDQSGGTKVTLSFKDKPKPRSRALVPELVDLKITDFCPYNCSWCYQGSSHKGQHAENPFGWLYTLHGMKVFEVAVGGGEPTLHPEFRKILDHNLTDLVVNFSTRNLDWVCYNNDLIREKCGSFALSVDGDYHKTKDILEELERARLTEKVTLQYVMGTGPDWSFEHLLELCGEKNVRLTLLGYKLTGRGPDAREGLPETPMQDGDEWIEAVKKHNNCEVAIDTALAARTPPEAFEEYLLRRIEGSHSMYIDAVTNQAAISSYTTENMISVTPQESSIQPVFENLQKSAGIK